MEEKTVGLVAQMRPYPESCAAWEVKGPIFALFQTSYYKLARGVTYRDFCNFFAHFSMTIASLLLWCASTEIRFEISEHMLPLLGNYIFKCKKNSNEKFV